MVFITKVSESFSTAEMSAVAKVSTISWPEIIYSLQRSDLKKDAIHYIMVLS